MEAPLNAAGTSVDIVVTPPKKAGNYSHLEIGAGSMNLKAKALLAQR